MIRSGWLAVGLCLGAVAPLAEGDDVRTPVAAAKPGSSGLRAVRQHDALGSPRREEFVAPRRPAASVIRRAGATPEPLSVPEDAVPLPVDPPADAELRGLVDRYLPDASAEERAIWLDVLRGTPPRIAEDILSAREPLSTPGGPAPPWQAETSVGTPAAPRHAETGTAATTTGDSLGVLRLAERIVLHNIANAGTVGFKRSRPVFSEAVAADGLAGLQVQVIETAGPLEETGRPLDLAIDGPGFFVVRRGDEVGLTRRGTFDRDAEGTVGLRVGDEFLTLDPPIVVPAEVGGFAVAADGSVTCVLPGEDEPVRVGQVALARVADPSRLEPLGNGLSAASDEGGVDGGVPGQAGLGEIRQGRVEGSNVDLVAEERTLRQIRRQIAALDGPTPPLAAGRKATDPR